MNLCVHYGRQIQAISDSGQLITMPPYLISGQVHGQDHRALVIENEGQSLHYSILNTASDGLNIYRPASIADPSIQPLIAAVALSQLESERAATNLYIGLPLSKWEIRDRVSKSFLEWDITCTWLGKRKRVKFNKVHCIPNISAEIYNVLLFDDKAEGEKRSFKKALEGHVLVVSVGFRVSEWIVYSGEQMIPIAYGEFHNSLLSILMQIKQIYMDQTGEVLAPFQDEVILDTGTANYKSLQIDMNKAIGMAKRRLAEQCLARIRQIKEKYSPESIYVTGEATPYIADHLNYLDDSIRFIPNPEQSAVKGLSKIRSLNNEGKRS